MILETIIEVVIR